MLHTLIGPDGNGQVTDGVMVTAGGPRRLVRVGTRLCLACGERRALFCYRGAVKADHDHNLCFECFRAESNRLRARAFTARVGRVPLAVVAPTPSRMIGDRAGLMDDLQARRRRAQIAARRAIEAPEAPDLAETLAS
jgi:hypothetical protein